MDIEGLIIVVLSNLFRCFFLLFVKYVGVFCKCCLSGFELSVLMECFMVVKFFRLNLFLVKIFVYDCSIFCSRVFFVCDRYFFDLVSK